MVLPASCRRCWARIRSAATCSCSAAAAEITRHSTYRSQFVVAHYRWHPLHGERLRVQQRLDKHGQQVLHLEVHSDVSWELPAWMCDASVCGSMSMGEPQISLEALYGLRSALVEHFSSLDGGSSDSPDEEESRGDKTTAKTARPRAPAPTEPAIGDAGIAGAGSSARRPSPRSARRRDR